MKFVDVRRPPQHALPTKTCVGCGSEPVSALVDIPRTMPPALLLGVALALPLLLALAIGAVWGSRDLFDIMAGTGGRKANELRFLVSLPVVVPVLWSAAALIGIAALCRRTGLRLSLCRPCISRQRKRRALLALVLSAVFVALAALLYLGAAPALDDRKWGLLFLPWVVFAALLANDTPLGGIRGRALSNDVHRVLGARAAFAVLRKEHPEALTTGDVPALRPPRLELAAWAVPAILAGIAVLAPRLEPFPLECPYGTYPLSHRSGAARIIGCRAPDGSAHGRVVGESGGWNSSNISPGYSGAWRFGTPHGELAFLDQRGRVRARGHYVDGQPRKNWRIFDERGDVLEELEVAGDPLSVKVLQAHPHLNCARSRIEATGMPAWGTRACPRGAEPAPFVRVENARVVELGMRKEIEEK